MSRTKKIIIGVAIFIVILVGLMWGFLNTGGIGLVRLYQNYLSQDIPDKKYSWSDFTDRGPREMLSGYYAGADGSGFYMWTYSGLKRFTGQPVTSVYYYLDTCGMIRELEAGRGVKLTDGRSPVQEAMYYEFDAWKARMQKGDYVWVKRVGEGDEKKIIDKVWGNSNKAFPLDKITLQQCE